MSRRCTTSASGHSACARGLHMQRILGRAFAEREVRKRYEAIVAGVPGPVGSRGAIELPIAADWPNRPRQHVDAERGRPSVTHWEVLAVQDDTARLALEPLTGRTHQLRVHLQAVGHPILGDALYAPQEIALRAPRLLLHASALELAHPATGEPLHFASAVPF